jgi:predicted nuclease of predicted toxin-antitoxin system
VASALRTLRFNVSWVGNTDDKQPIRGSSDRVILSHAQRTNQTIVTINNDMVLLCAESKESVAWIDPRGRQIRREEMTRICLDNIAEWEKSFAQATEPLCIHQMRTKHEVLTVERAAHLVTQRMRRRRYRAAAKRRKSAGTLGPLALAWPDEEE